MGGERHSAELLAASLPWASLSSILEMSHAQPLPWSTGETESPAMTGMSDGSIRTAGSWRKRMGGWDQERKSCGRLPGGGDILVGPQERKGNFHQEVKG